MSLIRKSWVFFLAALLCFAAVPANAQINSNAASVSLSFTSSASLSITVTPGSISFSPAGVASSLITIVTTWNLPNSYHGILGFAYFSSSTALSNSGPTIPASGVMASTDGGAPVAFTQGDPNGGSNGIQYTGNANINFPAKPFSGSQTDTVLLSIPNTGSYSPGTYTGVLNFLATAS
jgi:hypothetical protein